jgi:hypothetical protein
VNRQRRILTATLVTIGLAGAISDPAPAAAASHYPLWVCGGRYGGWGWSRHADPFSGLMLDAVIGAPPAPQGYAYWYPAYCYDPFAYAYPYPRPLVINVRECGFSGWVPR